MNRLKFLMVATCMTMSLPVQAGFQFTGPINVQSQPQVGGLLPEPPTATPVMPAVPPAPVMSAPVIQSQSPTQPQAMPRPVIQSAPPAPIMQVTAPAPVAPQPNTNAIRWNPDVAPQPQPTMSMQQNNQFDMAVGFGEDVPLSVALQQVVPGNYNVNVDPQLTQGQKVSWQGGQQWPDVLDNMIGSLGMQARIQGNNVVITGNAPAVAPRMNQVASLSPQIQPYAQPQTQFDAPPQPITMTPNQDQSPQFVAPVPMAPTSLMPESIAAVDIAIQTTEIKEDDESQSIIPDVTIGQWTAQSGTSLRTVLESWSNLEGVDLFWSSDFDYPIVGDVNISGTFEEATERLLSGFSDAKPKPVGRLHPNLPHGPAVLLIETKQLAD